MGVILWYQIEFPDQGIKVSSDVRSGDYLVDAEITIVYAIGQPGTLDVKFKDLPLKVQQALEDGLARTPASDADGGVKIIIHLGYLDEPSSKAVVLTGRVEQIRATTRFPPLATQLTGHEEASFKLLNTHSLYGEKLPDAIHLTEPRSDGNGQPVLIGDLAKKIVTAAGLGDIIGPPPPAKKSSDQVHLVAHDAFGLLDALAKMCGAEILVQNEKVQLAQAVSYPPKTGLVPNVPNPALLAAAMGEDSLITVDDLVSARIAEFSPAQLGTTSKQKLITDLPTQKDVKAFDFTVLGRPDLRAGHLVVASLQSYNNPFKAFRVIQVTHSYSPQTGYTCKGRAAEYDKSSDNRKLTDQARRASALAINDLINGKIKDSAATFPSIDVAKVKASKADQRIATVIYGQEQNSDVASPSVDLDIPDGEKVLLSKPLVAPFAWHNVGLSVPVYQGMRAVIADVRDARDDALLTGFVWANQPKMDRPKAKDGDWWLCLPTEVSGSPPQPSGKGANDLTAADGRRVIEAVGLQVNLGKTACSKVGERPTEGDAEVLLIKHASGTTVQIDSSGNVTIDGGSQTVVLKAGGATLTVGQGKVAIS